MYRPGSGPWDMVEHLDPTYLPYPNTVCVVNCNVSVILHGWNPWGVLKQNVGKYWYLLLAPSQTEEANVCEPWVPRLPSSMNNVAW